MKRIIFIVSLLLLLNGVSFAKAPGMAPLNPEYIKYCEQQKAEKLSVTKSGQRLSGYIPPPNIFHTDVSSSKKSKGGLPPAFDLRDNNYVSPVKDQGGCGACWAFSTIASLESWGMKMGLGEYDLSENSMKECHGFLKDGCGGGNSFMSAAYLSRIDGPKLETSDPYSAVNGSCNSAGSPVGYITHYIVLPADVDLIKAFLHEGAAVYTAMRWENTAYRESDHTYCYKGSTISSTHTVTIVGWDDNKATAGGNGAWIMKNSWGNDWGENGYFYVSYYDTAVLSENAVWPLVLEYNPDAELYMYDKLGFIGSYGWRDETDYALIKFTANYDLNIEKVSSWIKYSGTEIDIEIYDDFDGGDVSNRLGGLTGQYAPFVGYYTFDLNSTINISGGDDYYIKIKYGSPSGSIQGIPVEKALDSYADPIIETGKCWISDDSSPGSWLSLGRDTTDLKFDLCIRAYTTPPAGARSELTTNAIGAVTETSAVGNGDILSIGSVAITQHGICWSTEANPTIADNRTAEGPTASTGSFTSQMTGLYFNTTYHYRAYASGSAGTAYGADMTFTTHPLQIIIKPLATGPKNGVTISSDSVRLSINGYSGLGTHSKTMWRVWRWDRPAPSGDTCNTCIKINNSATELTGYRMNDLEDGLKYGWQCGFEIAAHPELIWSDVYTFIKGQTEENSEIFLKAASVNLLSFPLWPENEDASAAFSPVNNEWGVDGYNTLNGDYSGPGDGLLIEPGRSYYVYRLSRFPLVFPITGVPVTLDADLEIRLLHDSQTGNGWNLIAPSNNSIYHWADIEIIDYDDNGNIVFGPTPIKELADPNPYIELTLWNRSDDKYIPGAKAMQPYNGYGVSVKQSGVSLRFPLDAQKTGTIDAMDVPTNESPSSPPEVEEMPSISGIAKSGSSGGNERGCFIESLVSE